MICCFSIIGVLLLATAAQAGPLTLQAFTDTGEMRIVNHSDSAYQIDYLTIASAGQPAPGDFNGDRLVDAIDYTVWRDSLGDSVLPGAGADGDKDGLVDQDDYHVWRAHFGEQGGGSFDPNGYTGLAAADGFPAGAGDGNGWEVADHNSVSLLIESYLLGASTFGVNDSASLGFALLPDAPQDLSFTYHVAGSGVAHATGQVVYVSSSSAATAVTPEPTSLLLGLAPLAFFAFAGRLRRARVLVGVIVLSGLASSDALAWNITQRWTNTQTDGWGLERGDATTLTWSVVPDGEDYSRADNSDLIDYLDVGWGVSPANRTPDLTGRPWWGLMRRAYDQYSRVSGLTMLYEPEQNADGADSGKSGDLRIGGVPFTWESDTGGTLADNTFPNNGDMRIDTYRGSDGKASWWHTNAAAFRNLISHESGHGVGLSHDSSSGERFVMETPLQATFWGLQFDDIYGFNRMYGDPLEKNGGNDTADTATDLGQFHSHESAVLGTNAAEFEVTEMEADWLGVDGATDEDWFRFSLTGVGQIDLSITPLGPAYSTSSQGSVDTSAMSDLSLQLFAADGETPIASANLNSAGGAEQLQQLFLPAAGDYYVRVDGDEDDNQFYRLDLEVAELLTVSADLNRDGRLTASDWRLFRSGQGLDLSGLTTSLAHTYGDIDGDGDNDPTDFLLFKSAYNQLHGAAAFAAIAQTPEPATLLLAVALLTPLRLAQRTRRPDQNPSRQKGTGSDRHTS